MRINITIKGVISSLCLISCSPVSAVTDDWGQRLELFTPPQRIISLAPHITELLYSLGAEQQLIAVTESCDYPQAAKQLPKVANAFSINYEALVNFKPDLVIAWGTGNGLLSIDRIKKLGIPVFVSEPKSLADVKHTILMLGELTHRQDQASILAHKFDKKIVYIRDYYQRSEPVRVFYHISDIPLMTLSSAHYITKMIELCGGKNVFSEMRQIAPVITREALYSNNIEMIASVVGLEQSSILNDSSLLAVSHQQVYNINADTLNRPTTRLLEGIVSLCQSIDQSRLYWQQHASRSAGEGVKTVLER